MDNTILYLVGAGAVTSIALFFLGLFFGKRIIKAELAAARQDGDRIIADAQKEAETMFKEKMLELRDEQLKLRTSLENEIREKKDSISRQERSLKDREANMKSMKEDVDKRRKEADKLINANQQKQRAIDEKQELLTKQVRESQEQLERIANLSKDQAIAQLKESLVDQAREDCAEMIKDMRDEARRNVNKEAKEMVVAAIQRSAADHSVENTVSVVQIPNDEIKGRIIGREGRNIRAFEAATGVDIIVDDTPETVVISGFDPFRREIARQVLEKLIADGRIHPARIEDLVKKVEKEMEDSLQTVGDAACIEAGVTGLHREMVRLVGRLKYRTSYGQNILQHSIETAHLTGLMCSQLDLDPKLGRRAGLLHDIGKAIDRYTEGTHVQIGVELAKKYREPKVVVNTIAAHHNDVEFISPIGVLAQAADAISGARPGARRETLELYIQRLKNLEEISSSFKGVQRSFAIQAGREIRIMVDPGKITDADAEVMSTEVARKIEDEMEYPGQIKVTVLREYVANAVAK